MNSGKNELWNPKEPLEIDADQFERIVVGWLARAEPGFKITHQAHVSGTGGDYALDALAEAEFFAGAKIRILIECKKYARPVNRDTVLGVHAKVNSLGLNKAVIFATGGFQRGAIEFASQSGIALMSVKDGAAIYVTRSAMPLPNRRRPDWVPEFAGELSSATGEAIHVSTIENDRLDALRVWLVSQ